MIADIIPGAHISHKKSDVLLNTPYIPEMDIDALYNTYWKPILEYNDEIDMEILKKELVHYLYHMKEVSEVYGYITGGRIINPKAHSSFVIEESDNLVDIMINDAIEEAYEEFKDKK